MILFVKPERTVVISLLFVPILSIKCNLIVSDPGFRWISVSFNILSKRSLRRTVRPVLPETVSARTKESNFPLSEGQWMGRGPQMPLV